MLRRGDIDHYSYQEVQKAKYKLIPGALSRIQGKRQTLQCLYPETLVYAHLRQLRYPFGDVTFQIGPYFTAFLTREHDGILAE